ncbi:hypothetical protein F441_10821 [Phytophthora nicotianae CJ01A1]|uniref:ISXO2-like transposase domain-containing protein n=1 Tax=Phytophthora nicotianae CJ01A1 TaxID=1317063 RepID=W2WUQ6_PHYNI|nr:hypothetical protein F441_10821 [Phytophthora nicotianae CJ01A1]
MSPPAATTSAPPSPYLYHTEDESLFAMDYVIQATSEEALCVKWCMEVGLVDKQKFCPRCGKPMRLAPTRRRRRCCRRKQHADGKEICRGLLTNSFFNESKLKLRQTVLASTSLRAAHECYAFCRSTGSKELFRADFQIGSDGQIVEIDETSLSKKQKYHRGRHYEEFWLFGGVERGSGRWFGRIVHNKRTKATLLPILKRFVKPRTHIMSDMFATIKRHVKSMRGMRKDHLDSYLDEYMWRSWFFPPKPSRARSSQEPFLLFKNLDRGISPTKQTTMEDLTAYASGTAAGGGEAAPHRADTGAPVAAPVAPREPEEEVGCSSQSAASDSEKLDDSEDEDFTPDSQASSYDEEPLTAESADSGEEDTAAEGDEDISIYLMDQDLRGQVTSILQADPCGNRCVESKTKQLELLLCSLSTMTKTEKSISLYTLLGAPGCQSSQAGKPRSPCGHGSGSESESGPSWARRRRTKHRGSACKEEEGPKELLVITRFLKNLRYPLRFT